MTLVPMKAGTLLASVALVLIAGCAPVPVEPVDAQSYYFDQVVAWEDCESGAQCAVIRAPLNWNDLEAGKDIELALSRHGATGDAIGSLLVNPGGPGASGFEFVRDSVDRAVGKALRESFDIVGWDPRGVGRSSAVSCAQTDAELDYFFFGELEAEPGTPEWEQELLDESIRFGQECLANTGELLEFVDTISTVRDLDLMRQLLGDDQLNYLGYSYGTLIGALYINTFPSSVGRIVLDGPVDPSASQFELVLNQHRGFEEALIAYVDYCVDLGTCPFAGDRAAQLAAVSGLYDRLESDPLRHSDGRLVDNSTLRTAMVTTLYSQENWSFLTQLFREIDQDVTTTAMFLVDFYYDREGGVYQDNSMQAFIAINCLDYPVEFDKEVIANQAEQLREVAPYTARPRGYGDLVCQNWPYPPRLTKGPVTGDGANPVVIIGTTGDPATPYNWSLSLAEQLGQSRHLTLVAEGHLAYNKGSSCINEAVEEYFVTGALPPDGLVCSS
jgi:pimeloyl-ACP methyl ester carboxylesterase